LSLFWIDGDVVLENGGANDTKATLHYETKGLFLTRLSRSKIGFYPCIDRLMMYRVF